MKHCPLSLVRYAVRSVGAKGVVLCSGAAVTNVRCPGPLNLAPVVTRVT